MTPERLVEIEQKHTHTNLWPKDCEGCELLAVLREAQQEIANRIVDHEHCAEISRGFLAERNALRRRVEALEKSKSDQVHVCCQAIFEEDWDHFSERPTLMDAIQHHVEATLRGEEAG